MKQHMRCVSRYNQFPPLTTQLIMSCDFNNGEILRAEAKLSSKYSICDNKWHNVSAFYDTDQLAIRIDNRESVVASSNRNVGKLQTKSPLYIGGIPGESLSLPLPRSSFRCEKQPELRRKSREKKLFSIKHMV
jgi:laminin alpha 1/2